MKFGWSEAKNKTLLSQGRPGFEQVVDAIASDGLIEDVESTNPKYSGQNVLILKIDDYVCYVPYREDKDGKKILITVIPSRKLQKKYRGKK